MIVGYILLNYVNLCYGSLYFHGINLKSKLWSSTGCPTRMRPVAQTRVARGPLLRLVLHAAREVALCGPLVVCEAHYHTNVP